MQTTDNCLVEQLLCKVEASVLPKGNTTQFYSLLKQTLCSLLENASNEDCKVLKKDGALSVLELSEVKSLLVFLGFNEEDNQFVYCESDENLAKLQRCLSLILNLLADSKTESESAEELPSSPSTSLSPVMSPEHGSSKREIRSAGGSMKELLLAKHLKKEQLDGMAILRKNHKRHSSKPNDFTFNNSGFFHQSSNNNASRNSTTRRNRLLMQEVFHQQESYNARGWTSSSFNTKMA